MPISLANSRLIYDALKACKIKVISIVVDTHFAHLMRIADDDPDMTLVLTSRAQEALSLSSGVYLAGANSTILTHCLMGNLTHR